MYNIQFKRFVIIYIILAVVAVGSGIVSIWAMGEMAQAAEFHVIVEMNSFLLLLAIAGIIQAIFAAILAWQEKRYSGNTGYAIRRGFYERLLKIPYKQIAGKSSGEGASLFTVDVPTATDFLSAGTLAMFSQAVTLLVTAGFMLFINWWLTLIYLGLFPVFMLLQEKLSQPIAKRFEEVSKRRAEYNEVVKDSLQNPLTILAYNLESKVDERFTKSFSKYYKTLVKSEIYVTLIESLGIITTQLPVFVLYFSSAALVINGTMAISEFITLLIISRPLDSWLQNFAWQLALLQESSASAKRLVEFAPIEEDSQNVNATTIQKQEHAAYFNEVTFGYVEEAKVLSKLSFRAKKGKITAITGASGCGKSTILKLLLGLYKHDSGEIALSSDSITYVPQDCHLLPMSIRDNILAGLPLDEDKLNTACENAGILCFIKDLPDGFDSVLSESAANISGGQKQRLALARAFYHDADILLFDEATSSLDMETERSVLEALRNYITETQKAAIIVAHRHAVQEVADETFNLDEVTKFD
jgi:ABC-type bacteriocin/lantibiotic exporter with double-glycine peptidase domain